MTAADISRVHVFLQQSTPLGELIIQIRLSFLTPHLKHIVENSTPQTLSVHNEIDNLVNSRFNKFQTFVEGHTGTQCDWWPFQPRIPTLTRGQSLLRRKVSLIHSSDDNDCTDAIETCGQNTYLVLSSEEAASTKQLVDAILNHTIVHPYLEVQTQRMTWLAALSYTWYLVGGKTSVQKTMPALGTTTVSRASQKYTPGSILTTGQRPVAPPGIALSTIAPGNPAPSPTLGSQSGPSIPTNLAPEITHWIVFGIQNRRGYHKIEIIEIHKNVFDPQFFQELKTRFRKHRGWLRRLLSPYKFRYCRFVMVRTRYEQLDYALTEQYHEIIANQISHSGEALPDYAPYKSDYDYNPRPPSH